MNQTSCFAHVHLITETKWEVQDEHNGLYLKDTFILKNHKKKKEGQISSTYSSPLLQSEMHISFQELQIKKKETLM